MADKLGKLKTKSGDVLFPHTKWSIVEDKPNWIGSSKPSYTLDEVDDGITRKLSDYLPKLSYEWNKDISFGNTGFLKIGSFQMYDSNVTIDINATTSTTYHGIVVIATQNTTTSSIGSAHVVRVYGDPSGVIASSLRVVWTSGSRNYDVYFVPQAWSKNIIHIRAVGIYGASDICVSQTGTVPSTTSGLEPVTVLTDTFLGKTSTAADSTKLNGQAASYYQTALATQTAYSAKGSATKVPQITTNSLGQVTGITEVTITQPTVNNGTLTLQIGGVQKATFSANQSGNVTFNVTAADLGLSQAMKFLGTSATAITDGATTNPITIGSTSTTVVAGNVVLYGAKEFVWTGSAWEELGNEGSYALSSVSITGTGALGGGGTLASNRTITHNELNTSGAKSTSDIYKVTLDKYGHVLTASAATLDDLEDGSTRKLANYIPIASGASSLGGSIIPNTTNNIDLGSSTKYFKNIFGKNVSVSTELDIGLHSIANSSGDLVFNLDDNVDHQTTWTLPNVSGSKVIASISDIPTNLNQLTNGPGYVTSSGVTSVTIQTSGTGISVNSTSAITSTGTRTITLDSSSAGNAAANKVVLRNASGSIQSEKVAISSGATTKATMQYNSTDDCIEFVWA